jgi:hypothetical protein
MFRTFLRIYLIIRLRTAIVKIASSTDKIIAGIISVAQVTRMSGLTMITFNAPNIELYIRVPRSWEGSTVSLKVAMMVQAIIIMAMRGGVVMVVRRINWGICHNSWR